MELDFSVEGDANKNDESEGSKTLGSEGDGQTYERGEQKKEAEGGEYLDMEKTVVPAREKVGEPRREHEENGQQIPGRSAPPDGKSACLPVPGISVDGNLLANIPQMTSKFLEIVPLSHCQGSHTARPPPQPIMT